MELPAWHNNKSKCEKVHVYRVLFSSSELRRLLIVLIVRCPVLSKSTVIQILPIIDHTIEDYTVSKYTVYC